MLNFLLTHRFAQIHPTLVPNSDEVKIDNVTYLITDLGGDKISRKKWREYFDIIDGIIFMIDASDAQRIQDAKHEIDLLREVEKLQHIPIAILGNKEDKSNCLNENELREQLGLTRDKTYGNDHNEIAEDDN
ncbi:gtp-binding protein sar1 [Stylonychia lemnae]|uniref:Gtp-binding protein sar1 n=1 Tax=Stylonychia lemnae TaxID=5949 RepID=A0A078BAN6_STYLE|nr:gtp-binding protein sar1 [Stylonychia lemnae]|eukprot:CDW91630.1 gtp-binding protein sar1 [Stylonychia lemnae]